MADAVTSYVGLRLGAREVVLPFLNEAPWAVWLVAAAKLLGIYVFARLGAAGVFADAGVLSHSVAVANNAAVISAMLGLLPPVPPEASQTAAATAAAAAVALAARNLRKSPLFSPLAVVV